MTLLRRRARGVRQRARASAVAWRCPSSERCSRLPPYRRPVRGAPACCLLYVSGRCRRSLVGLEYGSRSAFPLQLRDCMAYHRLVHDVVRFQVLGRFPTRSRLRQSPRCSTFRRSVAGPLIVHRSSFIPPGSSVSRTRRYRLSSMVRTASHPSRVVGRVSCPRRCRLAERACRQRCVFAMPPTAAHA